MPPTPECAGAGSTRLALAGNVSTLSKRGNFLPPGSTACKYLVCFQPRPCNLASSVLFGASLLPVAETKLLSSYCELSVTLPPQKNPCPSTHHHSPHPPHQPLPREEEICACSKISEPKTSAHAEPGLPGPSSINQPATLQDSPP